MAKFCPKCGTQIEIEDAQFCVKCGAKQPITSPEPALVQPSIAVCKSCGNPIKPGNVYCNKCMVSVPQQKGLTTPNTTKKRSALEWIAIGCGGIILLIIISAFIGGMMHGISGSSSTSAPALTVAEIKSQAQSIPYASLMRNPDMYKDRIVYFKGKVVQVQQTYGNNYYLRIATKQTPYLGYFDDVIYVDYNGNRLLEDDIVDVWGKSVGLKSYTAVLGNEITIPEINALHVEMVAPKT